MKVLYESRAVAAMGIACVFLLTDLPGNVASRALRDVLRWAPGVLMVLWVSVLCVHAARVNGRYAGVSGRGGRRRWSPMKYGLSIAAVVAVILSIFRSLAMTVFFPAQRVALLAQARESIERRGNPSPEKVRQAVSLVNEMLVPSAVIGSWIIAMGCGLAGSLIALIITKNKSFHHLNLDYAKQNTESGRNVHC